MADPSDTHLINRIIDRDAAAERHLRGKGLFRNVMARSQLTVANAIDTGYAIKNDAAIAAGWGFLQGIVRGAVFALGAALLTAGLMGPAAGVGAVVGMVSTLTFVGTLVYSTVSAYRRAIISDKDKGGKIARTIAEGAGAIPIEHSRTPKLVPSHAAAADPNIYQDVDASSNFKKMARKVMHPPQRGA